MADSSIPPMPQGMGGADETQARPTVPQQPIQQEPIPQQPIPQPEPPAPKLPNDRLHTIIACLVAGIVGALIVVCILFLTGTIGRQGASSGNNVTISTSDTSLTTAEAVAQKCLPSVVSITVSNQSSSGSGSGVILDTNGNILTNYHIVGDMQSISVTIDGKSFDAVVVGSDASSDLAVIKVDVDSSVTLTPAEIGSSADLKVGEWVMTIGSPFGLDQSVSAGIVSALYRNTIMSDTSGNTIYTNLIQTDAAINPGNSGGALVNEQGKLVGISSMYSSSTESSASVGFAIPIDYAKEVADTIISGNKVLHAYIGLGMSTVNAQTARKYNLSVNQGAYVSSVTDGSPAANAGIQVGDIITKIGDQEITSADSALLAVRSHNIGDEVDVTFRRGNSDQTVKVKLGDDSALQDQQKTDTSTGNGTGTGKGTGTGGGISLEDEFGNQDLLNLMLSPQGTGTGSTSVSSTTTTTGTNTAA